jgi:3-oxoacyl-[acyl-carrier protein] reductase
VTAGYPSAAAVNGAACAQSVAAARRSLGSARVDLALSGSVALVTGASKGIGRGIAAALVREGALVAVAARSRERIERTAAAIGAEPFVYDSHDVDGAPRLVEAAEERLGPLGVLVTNTGGPPHGPDALAFTREQWEDAYRTLVLSPMALIEAAVPGMRERGFGRIVNVSSTSVREPIAALMLSNAHRSATLAAFKTLARQLAGDGITLNTILTGRIATDRIVANYGSIEAAERAAATAVPSGRLGTVDELAAVAVFLSSGAASYVTGEAVRVDGGMTAGV